MACRGVHFSVAEEQVQRLLAAGDDEELLEVIEEIEEDWDEAHLAETDKAWDAIHRCLSDGSLSWEGGEYPLNHCVLGGQSLYEGDDYIVSLKTPEQVRDVASALAGITQEHLRDRYAGLRATDYPQEYLDDEDHFTEYTWYWFEGLKAFYTRAAADGRAVVFTVDQ